MKTEEKMLDAAFDLFSGRGYKATTTKLIAEKAGVNEVTIFRHFDSKMDLFRRVIEQQAEERKEIVVEEMPEPTGDLEKDMVMLGMRTHEVLMESSDFFKLLLSEVDRDPQLFQLISHVPEKFVEGFSMYLEAGKKKGNIRKDLDTEVAAFTFLSFFFRAMIEKAFLGEGKIFEVSENEIREHIDIFLEGVQDEG